MDQLSLFIQQERARGQLDEQIRQTLLNSGHQADLVEKALNGSTLIDNKPAPLPDTPKEPNDRFGLIMMFVVIIGSILLGVGGGLALRHFKVNKSTVVCTSESCFAPKFASCSPATLNFKSPLGSVRYVINGPKGEGCSMLFEYTSNPNKAWVNQPMTCNFNNNESLENTVTETFDNLLGGSNRFDCAGPLVAILQSQ